MTSRTEARREPLSDRVADAERTRPARRSLKLAFGFSDPQHRTFDWERDRLREFADHGVSALSLCGSIGDQAARYAVAYGGYRHLHFTVLINANTRILVDALGVPEFGVGGLLDSCCGFVLVSSLELDW